MYLDFYRIDKKPFELSVDPTFFWMSENHKEALAVLRYGLLDNKGFIMLTGDAGIGKTTLVTAFVDSLGSNTVYASIPNPGLKKIDFFNLLGATFNFGNKFSGKDDFLIAFRAFLEKCHRDGKQVLLIIDEAQRLGRGLMEEIRLLSNIELQSGKLLNIFFVGQDELLDTLDRHENRALRQRMTMLYHLDPLSPRETGEYIQHRLRIVGTKKKVFTSKAIAQIHAFSKGYPRNINVLCDHAMLAGSEKKKKIIGAPEIIACAKELKLKKKSDSEPSNKSKQPVINWEYETERSKKFRSISYCSLYLAAILFILLLFCFLYFPLRSGAPFSDILSYWMVRVGSGSVVSKQMPESSPAPTAFKITEEDGRSDPADVQRP